MCVYVPIVCVYRHAYVCVGGGGIPVLRVCVYVPGKGQGSSVKCSGQSSSLY